MKMGVIKDDRFIEGIFIAWAEVEKVRVRIADVAGPEPRAKKTKHVRGNPLRERIRRLSSE